VAQLLNERGGAPIDALDEARLREFVRSLAPILEWWERIGLEARRAERVRIFDGAVSWKFLD
jgi:hypothetical protein